MDIFLMYYGYMSMGRYLNPVMAIPIIISLVVFLLMIRKIRFSNDKLVIKLLAVIFSFLLVIITWYVASFATHFIFARISPENKMISCFELNEKGCGKRSDCEIGFATSGPWCFSRYSNLM